MSLAMAQKVGIGLCFAVFLPSVTPIQVLEMENTISALLTGKLGVWKSWGKATLQAFSNRTLPALVSAAVEKKEGTELE